MKALIVILALASSAIAQTPPNDIVLTAPAEPVELIVIKKGGEIEWRADKNKVARALFNEIAIRDRRIQELTLLLSQAQADAAPFRAQIEARKAAEAKKAQKKTEAKPEPKAKSIVEKEEAPKAKP